MFKFLWRLTKIVFFLLLLVAILGIAYLNFAPTFGAKATGESLQAILKSPNFNGEAFENLIPTQVSTPDPNTEMSAISFFFPPKDKNPAEALPSVQFDKTTFKNGQFVWFGHSTVLFKTENVTVLADPIFNNASPVPKTVTSFEMKHENGIDDLPNIDIVIISHDHYDHLDHKALIDLDSKVTHFLVPLGVKAHLLRWGISAEKITEMDWYKSFDYQSVQLTLTPSRHFSGRGIFNRMSTLWGSWVVKSSSLNVFFSGDSGYFDEFKKIGEKYGPFDIAFIENGAYNTNWRQIHMMPEESVQTSIDLNANVFFPIHWGKFDLSLHQWTDPIVRAKKEADKHNINIATPKIGEVFTATEYPTSSWWDK